MLGRRHRLAVLLIALFASVPCSPGYCKDGGTLVGGFPIRHLDEQGVRLMQENFRLFTDYVARRVGKKITLTPIAGIGDLRKKLSSGELDFTWGWTPIESLKIWDAYGLDPLVTVDPVGDPVHGKGYRYLLITRADNGCRDIDDLKGKTLLYLTSEDDLYKNVSQLFVEILLKRRGGDIGAFFKISPRKSGNDVSTSTLALEYGQSRDLILRVLSNPDIAASVNEEAYLLMIRRNPKVKEMIRIIASTDPFPPLPLFVLKGSDPRLRGRIKAVLLHMDKDPEGQEILRTVRFWRWVDVEGRDYDALRKMMDDIESFAIKVQL